MAKITGIGGVFFKTENPKELSNWYKEHLGLTLEEWGGGLINWENDQKKDNGISVWSVAPKDTKWFQPSESNFMINYRIDNMEEMIEQLKKGNVKILQGPEYHENGVFLWIMDPAGNKVELWEPMAWDDKNKK
ncbi:MAG: VOC family protein [Leptospiraceae bacterium]|nr:VOC family protein [Leptospiraceae bacterium]